MPERTSATSLSDCPPELHAAIAEQCVSDPVALLLLKQTSYSFRSYLSSTAGRRLWRLAAQLHVLHLIKSVPSIFGPKSILSRLSLPSLVADRDGGESGSPGSALPASKLIDAPLDPQLLVIAIQIKDILLVQLLVNAGVDMCVWTRFTTRESALEAAISSKQYGVAKLLIAAGADPTIYGPGGDNALTLSIVNGNSAMTQHILHLIKTTKPADPTKIFRIPLHVAAQRPDNQAIVMMLLDKDADVNAQDPFGNTALHVASQLGHTEICRILIQRGANARLVNRFNQTAMHNAALYGRLDICKMILEHDAGFVLSSASKGVLASAAFRSRIDVCELLLKYGIEAPEALLEKILQHGNSLHA
eukprot:jgi/Hompol1/3065/HPOL_006316-RA